MDHVGHGMVFAVGVPRGNQAEAVHKAHELGNVGLGFFVPNGRGVAAGLVRTVHRGRDNRRGHGLEFLGGHQPRRVLGADDVDLDSHVGAGVQHGARRYAHRIGVEDPFDGGQALTVARHLFGRREHCRSLDTEGGGGEALQLLAKDHRIGSAGADELDFLRCQSGRDIDQLFASGFVAELLSPGIDGQNRARVDREHLLQNGVAAFVDHGVALRVFLLDPVLEVDADAAGDANGRQEDRRDTVGAGDDRGNVDERHIGAGLLARPERNVVDARHARGADAHGAFLGNQHDPCVRVLGLERLNLLLRFRRDHAFAVQFSVGAGVRLVARRQQVGRNVALCADVGDDFDLFVDVRQLGKELGVCVAVQQGRGDGIAAGVRRSEAISVGLVEKHLGLEHVGSLLGSRCVVTQSQVEQHFDGRAAFHVRQELEGEVRGDFCNDLVALDNALQKLRLGASSAGRARDRVVDQILQRVLALRVGRILDVGDELVDERAVLNGFGAQTLGLPGENVVQVVGVCAHARLIRWLRGGWRLGQRWLSGPFADPLV